MWQKLQFLAVLDVPGLEGPGSQDECTKLQACLDNGPCRFLFGMHGQSS